ncbi:MAG: MBG domain-containing protein, partial [Isosphaeraceae bacterium]
GTGLGNYSITYDNGNLTVKAAPLTITAGNQSKTYGTALSLGTTAFTTSGLVNSNTVTGVTLTSTGAPASAPIGTPIVPSAATGSGLGNYSITYVNGTLTVNPSIIGNGMANTVPLDPPAGSVAYTPAQMRAAYGISSLTLDGSGQTIAIVDASAFTGVTNLSAGGTVNAIMFGGSANGSTLSATGSGNDVLIGGSGKDTLTDRGTGHNILIGGPGVDTLTGNGNDILISGTTNYDSNTSANIAALDAILAEWSSNDSYSLRISKIMRGVGPTGFTDALNSSTCQSDGVANTVSDGASTTQNNWFIVNSKDKVTKQGNETQTIV